MITLRTIWATAQGDPVFMRRTNGWLTIFWIVMIPISLQLGWLKSIVYVSALSLWALVSGHWAAWQAARVEVRQDEDADVSDVLDAIRELRSEVAELRLAAGLVAPADGGAQLALDASRRRGLRIAE